MVPSHLRNARTAEPVPLFWETRPRYTSGMTTARTAVFAAVLVLAAACAKTPPPEAGKPDWLIDPSPFKAGITVSGDGRSLVLANGLIRRTLRVAPDAATIEFRNLMTDETILRAVATQEERAKATGLDIRTVNPVPSNIKGGISSLEEKSLGAIHKAGTAPIQGVLKYAERPPRKGLFFVDNWMGHLSIFAGYVAAGANVVLFQLGGGGVAGRTLLEGSPSVVAPFLWCTANPKTYAAATDSVDFYSGTVIEGSETPKEAGERLYRTVIDIASGTLSRSETLYYTEPIDMYLQEPRF